MTTSRDKLLKFVLEFGLQRNAQAIAALNLPASFTDVIVSMLLRSWPSPWRPAWILMDSWRALIYPFYCLPAWWFVGRGTDALLQRRRLIWPTLLVGSLFFLLFVSLLIGFRFAMPELDRVDFPVWVFWGCGLWSLLFAVFPAAWIRQRALDKKALAL